jgi:carbon monoxide dehydrogenase subunit G
MRTSESVRIAAAAADVYPLVSDLGTYAGWLPLVHSSEPDGGSSADAPAWYVELRAQVGPFARSKRLRMVRVETIPDRRAVFERRETDGRDHARWSLRAELDEQPDGDTEVTMHLAYDGGLWTGGILERILDEEIRRGRDGLARAVSDSPRQ